MEPGDVPGGQYGEEKFAQLYAVFKSGKTTDNALQQVYGFDQEGLEDAWRASLGLAPREGTGGDDEEPSPTFPPSNGGNGAAREDEAAEPRPAA